LSIKEINCQESRENNMLKCVTVCIIPTIYYAYEHITEEKITWYSAHLRVGRIHIFCLRINGGDGTWKVCAWMERYYYNGSERNRAIRVVWIHVELYEPQEADFYKCATVFSVPLKGGTFLN
jgi:hypothetical protein